MKKKYFSQNRVPFAITVFLLLTISITTSCEKKGEAEEQKKIKKGKLDPQKPYPDYKIVEIEGCEYFSYVSYYNFLDICHKGNCKNPIHCYNPISSK